MKIRRLIIATIVAAGLAGSYVSFKSLNAGQRPALDVDIGLTDVGGVVTSKAGAEAGVWVIAETTNLPTRFAKAVVTDDRGRYVIPALPKATYDVWVRGYGLVDSPKVKATPGQHLNLTAMQAPTAAAAAEYYPGMYWYSMMRIPAKSEFPGTGSSGNGIEPVMKDQHYWIDTLKNSCQSCHALGSKGIRSFQPEWGPTEKSTQASIQAWTKRLEAGQARTNMSVSLNRFGARKALAVFADWTDRIAAGELPFAKPARPQGVERNAVITMWEWSTPKGYLHDAISTDKRNPRVNANGLIYGSTEESTDMVPTLNPITNEAAQVKHPYRDPNTPSSTALLRGRSPYWGDEAIWDGHTSIHNPIMDEKGRMWFTARIRPTQNPDFCKTGSDHPSAKVAPLNDSDRQLSMYDPKTGKWSLISTCFTTQHLYFANDANNTLWTSAGRSCERCRGVVEYKTV
jgi:hypothetical protein